MADDVVPTTVQETEDVQEPENENEEESQDSEDDEEESKTDTATTSEISRDKIDAEEVFDIIRNIQDPEHPNTLEELAVVSLEQVKVVDEGPNKAGAPSLKSTVDVRFT